MAGFTPTKHEAEDFHDGVEYIDGDGTVTGDFVRAEDLNSAIEGVLYAQDTADNAKSIAQKAKDLIDTIVENAYAPPPIGMHHIQYSGEPTPASIWAGTSWEIDTKYQGRVLIGSGGSYTLGATGGNSQTQHSHNAGNLATALSVIDGRLQFRFTQTDTYSVSNSASLSDYVNETDKTSAYGIKINGATGNKTLDNMPPYAVVNYWKRTA